MRKIFIVEDDEVIAAMLVKTLSRWEFDCKIAEDFSRVDAECAQFSPDLVLMDVALPQFNGFYWCGRLRENSDAPIVFLSSRSDDMDIVMGMTLGGDDYIAKPVSADVLAAKIQAVLRRTGRQTEKRPTLFDAELDSDGSRLLRGGKAFDLTKNELKILTKLMSKKGKVVSRDELMLALWNSDEFVDDNTLTVNVNRLRRTLADAELPQCVKTHKGAGYSIDDSGLS